MCSNSVHLPTRSVSYWRSGAEAVDRLDDGAVVPAAIEETDLAAVGKRGDVALEVPLAAFHVAGLGQGDHARRARIEVLDEAANATSLARGIATFEQNGDAATAELHIALELHHLDLQKTELALVLDKTEHAPDLFVRLLLALEQPDQPLARGDLGDLLVGEERQGRGPRAPSRFRRIVLAEELHAMSLRGNASVFMRQQRSKSRTVERPGQMRGPRPDPRKTRARRQVGPFDVHFLQTTRGAIRRARRTSSRARPARPSRTGDRGPRALRNCVACDRRPT